MPRESFEWTRKGLGQDYYGVREYVRGDSLRHISWKSSAKHGTLIVKEYQEELNPSAALILLLVSPRCGSSTGNSLEDGIRAVASIADYHSRSGGAPELVIPAGDGFEIYETGNLHDCLRALAGYREPDALLGEDLERAILFSRSALIPGTALTLVTNMEPEDLGRGIETLPAMDGYSLVSVLDDSYAGEPDERAVEEQKELLSYLAEGRLINLFAVTGEDGISKCLSEPLNTTVL
jgi:hypothetical protein